MAKILTAEQMLYNELEDILDINQILKLTSSLYYIDSDNNVYCNSNERYLEIFARLPEDILPTLRNIAYSTETVAEFKKEHRKSTMCSLVSDDDFVFGQTEKAHNPDIKLSLVRPIRKEELKEKEAAYIAGTVIPQFYKSLFIRLPMDFFDEPFIDVTKEELDSLNNNELVMFTDKLENSGKVAFISKVVFPTIKKSNSLQYRFLDYHNTTGEDPGIAYVVFRQKVDATSKISIELYTAMSPYQYQSSEE